jgi:excisionase family DNA binding protein
VLTFDGYFQILQIGSFNMAATALMTHIVAPEVRSSATSLLDLLAGAGATGAGAVKLVLEPAPGRRSAVTLPDGLVDVIKDLAVLIQGGRQVSLFADDPEVTPEQASDLLGMSRPVVVQRIKRGDLKAHMVGAHHRIRMSDLIAFRRREMEQATAEVEARSKAVRFAITNTAIEGGRVLPETEAILDDWARGDIDDDQMMEETLRRFGPGA